MKNTTKNIFVLILMMMIPYIIQAQSVGSSAPDFTLNTLDGNGFTLSDYKGKVVFIFFFGYACPHCLANGPNTETGIYDVYRSDSEFVAIGIDTWDGNSAGVENFQSSTGIQYPLCLKGGSVEEAYQTTYDRIIIVSKSGIIKFKSTSDATTPVVEQAAAVIEQLLLEDPPMEEPPMEDPPMEDPPMEGMVTGLVETADRNDVNIAFPNPARNSLFINTDLLESGNYKVDLLDTQGRKVYFTRFEKNDNSSTEISLPDITDGLYIIRVSTREVLLTQKIMIRK